MSEPRQTKAGDQRTWRPPTRRAFFQLLAATAAAVTLRDTVDPPERPIWIGHF